MTKTKNRPRPRAAPGGLRDFAGAAWWCVLSGVLVFTSFPFRAVPDSGLWPLAWVALVPFLWALRDAQPLRAFQLGFVAGLVTNFGGFWWISGVLRDFGHLPGAVAWPITVLNAAYQGLQFAIFGLALVSLRPRAGGLPNALVVAALWTAVEYAFPLIFPWFLGSCQFPFPAAIQVADLLGVSGVTFGVALGNALAYRVALRASGRGPLGAVQVGLAAALLVAQVVYGFVRIGRVGELVAAAPKLRVGMVEANIGIWEKEAKGLDAEAQRDTLHGNLLLHQRLSADLAREGAELVVWPESSYIPIGDVHGKRLDFFAAGVGPGGHLALWKDFGDVFQWTLGPSVGVAPGPLRSVHASREDAVAMAGDGGRVLLWDGDEVRTVAIPVPDGAAPPDLAAVAVTSARGYRDDQDGAPLRILAAGGHGALYAGAPEGLRLLPTGTSAHLRALAVDGPTRALAVGDDGTVLALLGDEPRLLEVPTTEDLLAVWIDGEHQLFWATGAEGSVLHGTHDRFVVEETPVATPLRAVTGIPGGPVWAAGEAGTILRRIGPGRWEKEPIATRKDLLALSLDLRGRLLAADRDGGLWLRREGKRVLWERLDAPGIGPQLALTPLPWVRMRPIPKDARHLRPSDVPLPSADEFAADPAAEFRLPSRDRHAVQRGFRTPVLFGAITWEPAVVDGEEGRRLYNTAVLLDAEGRVAGMADKVYLLVFGEYIPLGEVFPALYDLIPEASRFTPGTDVRTIDLGGERGRLGVMICYEDLLPRFSRELMSRDPRLLVNVTNDAWFGETAEPYHHLGLAVMRTVEARRALVRSTNTGVSAIVDPAGRVVRETDLTTAETVLADVPLLDVETPYTRWGDLFPQACLALTAALVLAARLRRKST